MYFENVNNKLIIVYSSMKCALYNYLPWLWTCTQCINIIIPITIGAYIIKHGKYENVLGTNYVT